jgi:tRNA-splicing ligase RtcB
MPVGVNAVPEGVGAQTPHGGVSLVEETPFRWRIERSGAMRVPGIVFASKRLLPSVQDDRSLEQVANVATLPGIVRASFAMPDVHWGYGFPIGGVAATDVERGGVISPGGVGFDISCGVRLLLSDQDSDSIGGVLHTLMDDLDARIPRGVGPGGVWALERHELNEVLVSGAQYAVERGFGGARDLAHCEDGGWLDGADPSVVSPRAIERGVRQVGSLGSGNHFLEIQTVDRILDETLAESFGLRLGQVTVMIHSGSRGLGHQICTDHVEAMMPAMKRYGITVPDDQLACAPVDSPEGAAYLGAMVAAANFGRANRQLLTHATRAAFERAARSASLEVLYDVSHNLAKLERHVVDGRELTLCVHRKGATRALPPDHPDLPPALRPFGQPVLAPGSMGTASYVLAGVAGNVAFDSCCHGAGRTMSRHAATRRVHGRDLARELEAEGILVRARSWRGLAEEAPFSYKDVEEVVRTCEEAGLARRVARLRPIGVVKA